MMITFSEKFKNFIRENSNNILNSNWDVLYDNYKYYGCCEATSILTQTLMNSKINPLDTLIDVPSNYLNGDKNIEELILRSNYNLKSISQAAFFECTNLEYVELPENGRFESIGVDAFNNCGNMCYLYLPSTLKRIDVRAFYNCKNLKEICFGGSVVDWNNINQRNSKNIWYNVPCRKIECIKDNVTIRLR